MKQLLTAMLLLITSAVSAQTVNIPDSNFKNFLLNYYTTIDSNHDGEIQTTEAEAILDLDYGRSFISSNLITDLTGIQSFKNLKRLTWGSSRQSVMDISGLDQLKYLDVGDDSLTAMNINGCINLDSVWFRGTHMTNADLSSSHRIRYLTVGSGYSFNTFIIGRQDSLESLTLISTAAVNNNPDTLDLRQYRNLKFVTVWYSQYKVADLSGLNKLERVSMSEDLEEIHLSGCSALLYLDLTNNRNLKKLDLTGCEVLSTLQGGLPKIESLDISSCYNLTDFYISSPFLRYLNLRNGIVNTVNLGLSPSDSLNICTDEFETDLIKNVYPPSNYININFSSYCSFFPGGIYNTIRGKARLDASNDGCDSMDRGVTNMALKVTDTSGNSFIRYTAPGGNYGFYPTKGLFTLTPYFPYPYFTIDPPNTTVNFDTANNLTGERNFCISSNSIHNDLEITFLPAGPAARPGFNAGYTLVYKNRGTTTLSGNVQVNFDNSKMNFVSASENISAQSTGQLSWNYNNLQPFESRTINVTFNLLPPPVNNIGDTIIYLAAITPSANDETAYDNSFILPQRVRSSIDPNEKQCLEGSKVDISKINDYLHYQIHFQNEGTDTAFNIVVADTLSDKLDWNTLELISSSHPVDVRLKNNKAEFIFENIKLPYKAINEPASNGYVAFKIKPKPSVVIGDSLNNTAAIYFDFNRPVITNKAITIVASASIPVPVKVEYFSISSRDNINTLNWKAACTNGSARFNIERSGDGIHFSSIGNITATVVRCQLPFNFTDNDPVAGKNYYRLKITDADGISFYSKVLVTGNNKAGLQITAIANNIIFFSNNKQQSIQLKVIAADGKLIYAGSKNISAGNSQLSLSVKNSAAGIYTLLINTVDGELITRRFVK